MTLQELLIEGRTIMAEFEVSSMYERRKSRARQWCAAVDRLLAELKETKEKELSSGNLSPASAEPNPRSDGPPSG